MKYDRQRLKKTEQSNATVVDPEALIPYSKIYQMSVGSAAWETGIPVARMYNYHTYLPETNYSETTVAPGELVYAGQLQGNPLSGRSKARITAMRMHGGCAPRLSNLSGRSCVNEASAKWCLENFPGFQSNDSSFLSPKAQAVEVSVTWCSTFNPSIPFLMLDSSIATAQALI